MLRTMSCFAGLFGGGQLGLPMPKKFTYFGLATPVALPSQLCLELSGKSYEGKSVGMEEWPELKPKTPNGQLPFAIMPDGSSLCESGAIARTIAGAAGMLGKGKDYMTSEMLMGVTNDFNKKAMEIAPSVFTVSNFTAAKKQEYKEKKAEVIDFVDAKYGKFLLPEGDRFTKSGLTIGEIDLFAKLYCHANGAFPEIKQGKLGSFYKRMSELPAVKKVIGGESQFGQLAQYLIPVPP